MSREDNISANVGRLLATAWGIRGLNEHVKSAVASALGIAETIEDAVEASARKRKGIPPKEG